MSGTDKTNNLRVDIAIVGAGMVGAALAASLRDTGFSIALIDAQTSSSLNTPNHLASSVAEFEPRVSALTYASRDLLADLGAWQVIAQEQVLPYRKMHVWDHLGTSEINFDAAELYQDALGYIIENQNVVAALHGSLSCQANVELFLECPIAGLSKPSEQSASHDLILADGRRISCGLLVAADGANSRIRGWLSMATREWDYQHHAIVATIKTEKAHQKTAWQRFSESGPLALLPLQDAESSDGFCSIVWSLKPERAKALMALDECDFAEALSKESEYILGNVEEVSMRHCIPLRQRHAKDYVAPGLALVGDAAHTIHPLAGQGVNLGFKDVMALSQTLKLADQKGLEADNHLLLKRYQRQRQGDNLLMMGAMEGFKRLFAEPDPLVRWARNFGLGLVNKQPFIKKQLAKHAMGLPVA